MNFIIYLVNEGLSKVLPFIAILVVANFIDVSSFGELTLYFILYEMLIIFISNNISATSRIDFFKLSKKQYIESKTYHILGSLLIFIVITFIFYFINKFDFKYVFILAISSFMRTLSYYVLADLQCREKALNYGIYNFFYILFTNLLFIILVMLNYGIESWFYSILLGSFLQFIFVLKYISNYQLIEINLLKIENFKQIYIEYKNGLIFIPQALGFWIKLGIDRILLAKFTSTLVVGHYMFAFQLSWPIMILSTAINLYMTPKINRMLKTNNIDAIKKLLHQFALIIMVFSALIYFISTYIINNFYYVKYYASLEYIPYIVITIVFQSIMMIYLNVFYYINQKQFVSKFIFLTSIIQAISGFLFISFFEIYGLLIFNIVFSCVLLIVILNKLNKVFKIEK